MQQCYVNQKIMKNFRQYSSLSISIFSFQYPEWNIEQLTLWNTNVLDFSSAALRKFPKYFTDKAFAFWPSDT